MLIRSFTAAAQLIFAAFAIVAFSAAAEAALITFVASNGDDARPCTVVTAPCKTLSRAYSVTAANGTIRALTPLQGNLSIAKSITIEGGGAAIVGSVTIANAGAIVILRGLHLNGGGTIANGIRINSAAAVHIEDCAVERYSNDGIKLVATTATKLFISDTVSSANSDGLYADALNAQVVIQNSHFDGNDSSGVYLKVAKASVTGSSSSGNVQNGFILLSERAKITETTANNNSGDGFSVRNGVIAFLNSAETDGNGGFGLYVEAGGEVVMNDCAFIDINGYKNDGILKTTGNNMFRFYLGNALVSFPQH